MKLNIDETIELLNGLKYKTITNRIEGQHELLNYFIVDGTEIINRADKFNDTDYMSFNLNVSNKNFDLKVKIINVGFAIEFRVVGLGGMQNLFDTVGYLKWVKIFGFNPSVTLIYQIHPNGVKYKWTTDTTNCLTVIGLIEDNKCIDYKTHKTQKQNTIPKIC